MTETDRPGSESQQVNAGIFEGLFIRALRADDVFAADLRTVGVDLAHLAPQYPIATWFAALGVARRRLHPTLTEEEGHRELGRAFLAGYSRTLVGSVLLTAAPLVGPARFVARIPRMLNAARPGGIRATAQVVGPSEWLLVVEDRFAVPGFHAGVVEEALTHCRASARAVIESRTQEGFSLRITW